MQAQRNNIPWRRRLSSIHLRQRAYDWLTKNVRVNVVMESNCPHSVLNPLRWVLKTCGYVRWIKNMPRANAIFRTETEEKIAKIALRYFCIERIQWISLSLAKLTARHPCFRKDRSLPSSPNPTTGGIELHHNRPSCTGSHTFVNEIVQEVDRRRLFNDGLRRRQNHVQSRRRIQWRR